MAAWRRPRGLLRMSKNNAARVFSLMAAKTLRMLLVGAVAELAQLRQLLPSSDFGNRDADIVPHHQRQSWRSAVTQNAECYGVPLSPRMRLTAIIEGQTRRALLAVDRQSPGLRPAFLPGSPTAERRSSDIPLSFRHAHQWHRVSWPLIWLKSELIKAGRKSVGL